MKSLAVLVFLVILVDDIGAQQHDTSTSLSDSVMHRVNQLVKAGREAEGRRIIDSVLKETTPGNVLYGEALYWRGANAPTAAEAERDYRRLLIEAPLAARAEDALVQLAQLTQARGDRRAATDYLQRFMLTYGSSPARPRVALSLVRLLFEMGPQQEARACEAYRLGREAIPPESLELRNQLEFYGPRCSMMVAEATPAPAADSAPAPVPTPAPDTTHRAVSPPSSASSFYSVQVAAYESREAAEHLTRVLVERGLEARVDGTARPFRVRVGKYGTRADAVKAAATLKSLGHGGFVTLVSGR